MEWVQRQVVGNAASMQASTVLPLPERNRLHTNLAPHPPNCPLHIHTFHLGSLVPNILILQ